jgi:hypothetical protein
MRLEPFRSGDLTGVNLFDKSSPFAIIEGALNAKLAAR